METQLPLSKGAQPSPIFGSCLLWPYGWIDQDATWYDGRPRPRPHCVRWGLNCRLPLKGAQQPPHFSAHLCCGQTAGWIKMPLGTKLSSGPGHIVLDGDPASLPMKGAQPPIFRSSPGGDLIGLLKSGVFVRPSVRQQKVFFQISI